MDGKPAVGYRKEDRVNPESQTEAYVALRVMVDNWRWEGVPFYIRVGKQLPKKSTEISIHFKKPPRVLFNKLASGEGRIAKLLKEGKPLNEIIADLYLGSLSRPPKPDELATTLEYVESLVAAKPGEINAKTGGDVLVRILIDSGVANSNMVSPFDGAKASR